jgi:hypothetical protein
MSRKDYIRLAAILARHYASEEMISAFCAELEEDNPRFNAQRFRDAARPLARKFTVTEMHERKIAVDTLNMADAMIGVMGGINKDEAISFLIGTVDSQESNGAKQEGK